MTTFSSQDIGIKISSPFPNSVIESGREEWIIFEYWNQTTMSAILIHTVPQNRNLFSRHSIQAWVMSLHL